MVRVSLLSLNLIMWNMRIKHHQYLSVTSIYSLFAFIKPALTFVILFY